MSLNFLETKRFLYELEKLDNPIVDENIVSVESDGHTISMEIPPEFPFRCPELLIDGEQWKMKLINSFRNSKEHIEMICDMDMNFLGPNSWIPTSHLVDLVDQLKDLIKTLSKHTSTTLPVI